MSKPVSVAAAQRMNDLRRLEREAKGPAATPRKGGRPAPPPPPVEVTATELVALKRTLEENTVELQKSQATLKEERRKRVDVEAKLQDLWMLERVHRSQDGPQRVMSEVAAQLEASGQAPWFRAEGTAEGLGLEGQELQRYQSGVRTTVQKIVVEETDAIAHRLDELLAESIRDKTASLQELLVAHVKDRVFKEVSKEVGRKAVELQAIMEASRNQAATAIEQIDRKIRTGIEMAEGKLSSELKLDLDSHKEAVDTSIANTRRDLQSLVTAEAAAAADSAVQENLHVEIAKLRVPQQFQNVSDRLDKLEKECLVESDLDPTLAAVKKLEGGVDRLSNTLSGAAAQLTLLQDEMNGVKARERDLVKREQHANLEQALERLSDSLARAQQTLDKKIAQMASKQELQDAAAQLTLLQDEMNGVKARERDLVKQEQHANLEQALERLSDSLARAQQTLDRKIAQMVSKQELQDTLPASQLALKQDLQQVQQQQAQQQQAQQQQAQQQQIETLQVKQQIEQLEMKLTRVSTVSQNAPVTSGHKLNTIHNEAPVRVDVSTTNVKDTLATQQPVEEIVHTANSSPSTNQLFSAAPSSDEKHATLAMPPGLKKMEQMKWKKLQQQLSKLSAVSAFSTGTQPSSAIRSPAVSHGLKMMEQTKVLEQPLSAPRFPPPSDEEDKQADSQTPIGFERPPGPPTDRLSTPASGELSAPPPAPPPAPLPGALSEKTMSAPRFPPPSDEEDEQADSQTPIGFERPPGPPTDRPSTPASGELSAPPPAPPPAPLPGALSEKTMSAPRFPPPSDEEDEQADSQAPPDGLLTSSSAAATPPPQGPQSKEKQSSESTAEAKPATQMVVGTGDLKESPGVTAGELPAPSSQPPSGLPAGPPAEAVPPPADLQLSASLPPASMQSRSEEPSLVPVSEPAPEPEDESQQKTQLQAADSTPTMPDGLSKMEQMKWKRKNGVATSVTTQPSAERSPELPPVPLASSSAAATPPPQGPQSKEKQSSESTAEAKPATQMVVGTGDLKESPGVTAGELPAPSSQPPSGLPAGPPAEAVPPPADLQLSASLPPASMQSRSEEPSLVPVSEPAPEPEDESQQKTQLQAADSTPTMPDGLSKMEQMKWKRKNGVATSVTTQPSAERSPELPPVPLASSSAAATPPPQGPQSKEKQSSESTAEAKPATQMVVGTGDLKESPGVTAGELPTPSQQKTQLQAADSTPTMPDGLSKMEQMKWKRKNGVATSVTTQPSAERSPELPPVPLASSSAAATPPPQGPQSKEKQSSESTAEAKPATQMVVGTGDLKESPGVTAGELPTPSQQKTQLQAADSTPTMPDGLSKMEQMKWKRDNGASAGALPSSIVASSADMATTEGVSIAGGSTSGAGGDGEMPAGLTKMQQVAWANRNKLNPVGSTESAQPVSTASVGETDFSDMPEGLSKVEQLKWKRKHDAQGQ